MVLVCTGLSYTILPHCLVRCLFENGVFPVISGSFLCHLRYAFFDDNFGACFADDLDDDLPDDSDDFFAAERT